MIWLVFLIITLAAVAALFLVPNLAEASHHPAAEIYRNQLQELAREEADGLIGAAEAKSARLEIERRLAATLRGATNTPARATHPRSLAIAGALIMVGSSLGIYTMLGRPDLSPSPVAQQQPEVPTGVAEMIARLELDLAKAPDDVEKWRTLAWAQSRVLRFSDSAKNYEKALALSPNDAEIKTSLAEALTQADGKQVPERARLLFAEALMANNKNTLAAYYLGIADEQAGNFEAALTRWRELAKADGLQPTNRDVIRKHLIAMGAKTNQDVKASLEQLDKGMAPAAPLDSGDMAQIDGMIAGLAQKLADNPDNLDGWKMLIRSLQVRQGPAAAREALMQAEKVYKDQVEAKAALKQLADELKLQ
jgi:cytochrome c-type biogenesis protein CcmH